VENLPDQEEFEQAMGGVHANALRDEWLLQRKLAEEQGKKQTTDLPQDSWARSRRGIIAIGGIAYEPP
jgi:hypothetical protein